MGISSRAGTFGAASLLLVALGREDARSQEPDFLRDRGSGVSSSIFATHVNKGELVVYPFYEYVRASRDEYHGSELGYSGDTDYLGKSTGHEGVLFVAYGLGEDVLLELESELYVTQRLERARDDATSGIPPAIEETGFGETEAQVRWRFGRESASRPELYANLEVGFPFQKDRVLIGSSEWDVAIGVGAVKGFSWGTITSRLSIAYSGDESELAPGEYAVEYLKRLSESLRAFAAVEGEDDGISAIVGTRWRVHPRVELAAQTAFGLTPKADDLAPEIGLLFRF